MTAGQTDAMRGEKIAAPLIAGTCATFLGIGVARFAYAPLLPAMIEAGWVTPGAAGLLGAVNLAGYLAGALLAPRIGRRFGQVNTLRCCMLLAAAAMAPCAAPLDLSWFLPWRILAGCAGGTLMVLTGPAIQAALPPRLHGLTAGLLFGGVGAGSVAGALIVPALLPYGLSATWLALSATGLALVVISWRLWPAGAPPLTAAARPARHSAVGLALVACYTLAGIAAAPHMQWWPDYLARGLGEGTAAGARSWLLWGLAAACAPIPLGRLADRFGARVAMLLALLVQAAALLLPLLSASPMALLSSVVVAGATATGVSAMVLTRARELAGAHTARLWSLCTTCYGASQTAAGFFLAWQFTLGGGHLPLFATGLIAALLALLLARR